MKYSDELTKLIFEALKLIAKMEDRVPTMRDLSDFLNGVEVAGNEH